MSRSAVLIPAVGALALAVALTAPLALADTNQGDETPTDPRLVVFELFNRSESGG